MSAADVHEAGPFADGGNRPSFARGDVLLVSRVAPEAPTQVLRVLGVEDLGDGWRLTVEPMTGEEPTDG